MGQYFQNSGLTHSRTLLAMADSLLKNLDIPITDIGLVAVSHGPGSFTGVRIGASAVKGLAWGLDIPVCGVSTLEAMALQTQESAEYSALVGAPAYICPIMDARRGQVYNALFEWQGGTLTRLCDDRAIALEGLASELRSYDAPWLLIGDGAMMSYDYLVAVGISCKVPPDLLRLQTAYGVALAALKSKPISAISLEPSYLRPSQAEREYKG